MIPQKTSKSIRRHKSIRSMRSLYTRVGPARGRWSRLRETEQLAGAHRPVVVKSIPAV